MVEPERARLRLFHALSASIILLFVAFHLTNHVIGLFGEDRHIAVMAAGRKVYRCWPVEISLLALFAWQAASGLALVIRGWRTRAGWIGWAQAGSGFYLALFILIHTTAVLSGRAAGIETDFRFAAQGMHTGLAGFFIPYYSLAVLALCTHLGCAAYWLAQGGGRSPRPMIIVAAAGIGAVLGGLIVASLAGAFFTVHPQVMA